MKRPLATLNAAVLAAAAGLFFAPAPAPAADPANLPDAAAKRLLADRLLNDARAAARSSLPPAIATRQALRLLQAAREITPDSLEVLLPLAEAAREARQRELLRDVLRQIVRLDPTDFVAQVNLLTLIAESAQTAEEQARVYQAALAKDSLDPQVRSEIATRYARLVLQRGDTEEARKLLDSAVKLNDVNAGAWEEIVRLQATGPVRVSDRMGPIVNCLVANPYLPNIWLVGGRALASANQHDLAAQFIGTAIDGYARSGAGGGEFFLEWATELAIVGDPRAEQVLTSLAKLEDAPPAALITSLAVTGPSITAAIPAADPIVIRIRARVADTVKASPDNKDVLSDAAWIEIFYMPDITPAATDYLDRLAKIAGDKDDGVLLRRGWLLLRQGKLPEATDILKPLSAKDPFAQLGMARIAAAQGDTKSVTAQLQDIYNAHPTGLLALQVTAMARKQKVTLRDTNLGAAVRKTAQTLPLGIFTAQTSPKDVMLIVPSFPKRKYAFGEPIYLTVKISNTTDRTLSVGPGAAIKSSFGLLGAFREPVQQSVPLYAIDTPLRAYRMAAHATVTETVRIDQERVYEALLSSGWRTYSMNVSVATLGIGGQLVAGGEFSRDAAVQPKLDELAKLAEALPQMSLERQMTTGLMLAQLLPEFADDKIGAGPAAEEAKVVRARIADALIKVLAGDSPILKAWFLRNTPESIPDSLRNALAAAGESRNTPVRIAGLWRIHATTHPADSFARADLHNKLTALAAKETDPILKDYATTLAQSAMVVPELPPTSTSQPDTPPDMPITPATVPPTQPATTPTASPTTTPATAPVTSPTAFP